MMTRRALLTTAASGTVLASCSEASSYEDVANEVWSKPAMPGPALVNLVHYATLAANSHNAQAWTFSGNEKRIEINPDLARALPAADSDNHHLYASLGCAAENLAIAASGLGLASAVSFDPSGNGRVAIDLAGNALADPLFATITQRQCTRTNYDGRAVPVETLNALARLGQGQGVEVVLVTDKARIEQILELIVSANTLQVDNAAFAGELKSWIRFSDSEAIATRDGLYAGSSGNPTMPGWLGRLMFSLLFSSSSENEKYVGQIRSSAGLAVFVSATDDKENWVRAGRVFQRFALTATAQDIRQAFVNQAVEVSDTRQQLGQLLGLGNRRPDFVVRFGYGPLMPRSLRRRTADVIVS